MKISLRENIKTSWKQFKQNYKFLVPLFLLVVVVSALLNIEGDNMFSLSGIISLFISPLIYFAVANSSLKVSRNEKVGFSNLFKGLTQKKYFLFLAINIFVSFAMMVLFGISALGIVFVKINPIISIAFSVALIALVFVTCIGVMFFPQYRLIDVGGGFWSTIKGSFALANGRRAFLVKFAILAILLNILGAILVGIGLLVSLPLTSITLANIYDKIKSN